MSHPGDAQIFDIAVSYASEDREFVMEVVQGLKDADVRVFVDSDYQTDMWGEDLIEYLDNVYRNQSSYTLMFISQHYASKMWTRHERRSALARGLEQSAPYVLPVRLDDSPLEGLRPTLVYVDARRVTIDGIVQLAVEKLGKTKLAQPRPITRVPRSEVERQQLLIERPPGWEYFYFAAELLHARNSVEAEYLDHEVGYAALTGELVTQDRVYGFLRNTYSDVEHLIASLERLMALDVQEKAFGAPGEPGDQERIHHLAHRWNDIYVALLRWASRLRGATVPSGWSHALDLAARFVNEPIRDYRGMVDDTVRQLDVAATAIAAGQEVRITQTLKLQVSPHVGADLMAELKRLNATAD